MKKSKEDAQQECGLGPAFTVIGGKWKAMILWEINTQPRRFGELKRLIAGISEKMLIQQLREMERDGIVHRTVYHEVPPKVEYSITKWGASLTHALIPIADWGEDYMVNFPSGKGRKTGK